MFLWSLQGVQRWSSFHAFTHPLPFPISPLFIPRPGLLQISAGGNVIVATGAQIHAEAVSIISEGGTVTFEGGSVYVSV